MTLFSFGKQDPDCKSLGMPYFIELAQLHDAPAILALQKKAYLSEAILYNDYTIPPLEQSLTSLEQEFQQGVILKIVNQDSIIASVRAYQYAGTGYIGKLVVADSHQNQGLGKQLMKEVEAYFKGVHRFELFTGHKSAKNLQLYSRLGYQEFRREVVNDQLTLIFLQKIINTEQPTHVSITD